MLTVDTTQRELPIKPSPSAHNLHLRVLPPPPEKPPSIFRRLPSCWPPGAQDKLMSIGVDLHLVRKTTNIMIPANLAPAARSAYRDVLRAARTTFQGDPARHVALVTALRATFESPTLTAPTGTVAHSPPKPKRRSLLRKKEVEEPQVDPTSPEELAKRIQEWKDVAEFLRRNVVQGQLDEQTGTYSEYR